MKRVATDQIHISGVSSDTLKPGTEFEVSDDHGEELLKKRPDAVEFVGPSDPLPDDQTKQEEKDVETAPQTKDAGAAPEKKC